MARLTGPSANLNAFLDLIAASEGTPVIPGSDDGYDVLVGATRKHPLLFHSYAEHPNVFNRELDSTAAGRYQIIHKKTEQRLL
jgi:muramidase (phage lysozyme)